MGSDAAQAVTVNDLVCATVERQFAEAGRPKPRWEGTPTFAGVWRGTAMGTQASSHDRAPPEHIVDSHWTALGLLNRAQPIVIDLKQMEALRDCVMVSPAEGRECLENISLWSPCIYLDLAGLPYEDDHGRQQSLAGALITQEECELPVFVFFHWEAEYNRGVTTYVEEMWKGEETYLGSEVITLLVLTALRWMECENVEVIDQDWPSRQVRRRAERDGTKISKICHVRTPKYRKTAPTGDGRNFTHRFTVRGHYSLHPKTTRMAQASPEKLSWVPERGDYFRRIWQPEHIKGDPSLPFIPKTKVVKY
jgi:hypothetical protein